jgi:hypothetical protein
LIARRCAVELVLSVIQSVFLTVRVLCAIVPSAVMGRTEVSLSIKDF